MRLSIGFGFRQVLEFAAGVAPARPCSFRRPVNAESSKPTFPELLEEKRLIVKALIPLSERTNYHLRSANVLDAEEVWKCSGVVQSENR